MVSMSLLYYFRPVGRKFYGDAEIASSILAVSTPTHMDELHPYFFLLFFRLVFPLCDFFFKELFTLLTQLTLLPWHYLFHYPCD